MCCMLRLFMRINKEIENSYIDRLNDLTNGETDWAVCLGSSCGLKSILNDDALLNNTRDCRLLPIERLPLENCDGTSQEDGTTSANWFQELTFDKDPVSI